MSNNTRVISYGRRCQPSYSGRIAKALSILLVGTVGVLSSRLALSLSPLDYVICEGSVLVTALTAVIGAAFAIFASISWRKLITILVLCLLPSCTFAAAMLSERYDLEQVQPANRFRDHLKNPIPASIAHLSFLPRNEAARTGGLILRFDIAPNDLDEIISSQRYIPVADGHFCNPADLFNDRTRLKLGDNDEFFQAPCPRGGLYTIRTTKNHASVIFRYEDEADVRAQRGFKAVR